MDRIDRDIVEDMHRWRHDMHANPEIAFREKRTSALVAAQLRALGLQVETGLAETGLVATLSRGEGGRIGLRADMDALAIEETSALPYRSIVPGLMHACGHDGHTAMLLGAAKQLSRSRNFAGTVHFIFQPAEENEGGARRMLEEGLLDRFPCDAVYAMHNWPSLPAGQFVAHTGPAMAAFDTFEVEIGGRGTHAAMPELGCDPFVPVGQILLALQSIPSRRLSAHEAAVVSVTQVHGGQTWNVIPASVTIRGSVRCFSETVREAIEGHFRSAVEAIAAAHGATARIRYERRYPATINSVREAKLAASVAAAMGNAEPAHATCKPSMASDDFGFLTERLPGAYVWLGSGDEQHREPLHSPCYDFNDRILETGARYWVRLIERALPRETRSR
jgi:hippurate hydrolase